MAATVERFGSLDILVNNAATNPYFGPLIEIDLARAEKTVQVNQQAVLTWTQCAWRASMAERRGQGHQRVVGRRRCRSSPASVGTTSPRPPSPTSPASWPASSAPAVRVNALAPGLVKTDFARALWERAGDAVAARLPLRRLGEPDDMAKAALFLASDAASWITGHVLVVDGGALAVPSGGV